MVILYTILVVLAGILVLLNTYPGVLSDAGLKSKRPARGRATMFDVRHLLMEGERDMAIQVYCEIFKTTPIKAKKDVEDLERSLKV